ncbi:BgTH12-07307 [Blumeria graminis f. sp. triticale]|nr:BgTH12-07307 [Blumeria graminis f. sp. triticale]
MVRTKNKKKTVNPNNGAVMSRQSPLPRGTPPSGPRRVSGRGAAAGDSYRPRAGGDLVSRSGQRQQEYPYQGSSDNTYRPNYDRRSLSPRANPYHSPHEDFRRDPPYRFGSGNNFGSREDNFSFRYDAPPGTQFRNPDRQPNAETRNNPQGPARQSNNSKSSSRGGYAYAGRASRVASDREFLRANRAPTPELLSGMDADSGNAVKYLPLEDLSDSDEAEMEVSGNEIAGPERKKLRTSDKVDDNIPLWSQRDSFVETNDEESHGTCKIEITSQENNRDEMNIKSHLQDKKDGDSVPRWSNPDPYTALPPPDESQRKKKDVVKLIRKARINSDNSNKPEAPTDDFISFDCGDEENILPPITLPEIPLGPRNSKPKDERHEINQKSNRNPLASSNSILTSDITSRQIESKNNLSLPEKPKLAEIVERKNPRIDLTPNTDLGSRKRNANDEIKQPPIIHQKGIQPAPDGRILSSWLSKDSVTNCPWILDHSLTSNMGLWLHKEIVDFYHYVKPKFFEKTVRGNLVDDLRRRVKNFDRTADIIPFGSFPAGLYLPTADLDLVMVSDRFMQGGPPKFGSSPMQVRKFAYFLEQERVVLKGSQECVVKAKVPLVKYVDNITGLKVDISFENTTGLVANKTFQCWRETFPAMPILVTVIKQFLAMRGLNEPVNGGIGGFSVACLVVSLLQQMPQVQSRSMIPEHHLGEILMEFFDLYGNRFNTMTTAISVNPAGYFNKSELNITYNKPMDKFSIIDPNNPANDIAGGSRNSVTIKRAFQHAYSDLQRRMGELQYLDPSKRRLKSVLSCIIGGNYNSFKLQREHLAHVHEKKIGTTKNSG